MLPTDLPQGLGFKAPKRSMPTRAPADVFIFGLPIKSTKAICRRAYAGNLARQVDRRFGKTKSVGRWRSADPSSLQTGGGKRPRLMEDTKRSSVLHTV